MNHCPYCHEKTISTWQKFKASDLYPAICSSCGKGSRMSLATNSIEGLLGTIIFPVVAVYSFFSKTWVPLIAFAFAVVFASVVKLAYLPMVAVNEKAVIKRYWFAFGALVVLFTWVVYDGYLK